MGALGDNPRARRAALVSAVETALTERVAAANTATAVESLILGKSVEAGDSTREE